MLRRPVSTEQARKAERDYRNGERQTVTITASTETAVTQRGFIKDCISAPDQTHPPDVSNHCRNCTYFDTPDAALLCGRWRDLHQSFISVLNF